MKIREAGHVRNKAIYVAIGVNMKGNKEVLGLWAGQAEGVWAAPPNPCWGFRLPLVGRGAGWTYRVLLIGT